MRKITDGPMTAFYTANATDVKTLDVGSAGGRNKKLFPNSITVDIDPKNKPDIVADAHHLPFEDNSFECIVCKEVLEHTKRPAEVIAEFKRVLRPGGKLILSTRFMFPIHEAPYDYWRFTRYNFEELFSTWSTSDIQEEADPVTTIVILIDRLIYQSDFAFNKVSKALLYLITFLILPFKHLLRAQYGDVTKSSKIRSAFTSGYYIVAYK